LIRLVACFSQQTPLVVKSHRLFWRVPGCTATLSEKKNFFSCRSAGSHAVARNAITSACFVLQS